MPAMTDVRLLHLGRVSCFRKIQDHFGLYDMKLPTIAVGTVKCEGRSALKLFAGGSLCLLWYASLRMVKEKVHVINASLGTFGGYDEEGVRKSSLSNAEPELLCLRICDLFRSSSPFSIAWCTIPRLEISESMR